MLREVKVAPVQETALPPVKLELQSTTTTVEVASDVQAVQLSNAEISSTITSHPGAEPAGAGTPGEHAVPDPGGRDRPAATPRPLTDCARRSRT